MGKKVKLYYKALKKKKKSNIPLPQVSSHPTSNSPEKLLYILSAVPSSIDLYISKQLCTIAIS